MKLSAADSFYNFSLEMEKIERQVILHFSLDIS